MINVLISILTVIQYCLFIAWAYDTKRKDVLLGSALSIPFAIVTFISTYLEIKEERKKEFPDKVQIVRCIGCNLAAVWMLIVFFLSLI